MLLRGDRLIQIWAGPAGSQAAAGILTPIVIGLALMGPSVSGTYAMQALGLFQTVALISVGGRAAMLLLMIYLLHHQGLQGRVGYGAVTLLVYLSLLLGTEMVKKQSDSGSSMAIPFQMQEETQS